MSGQPRLSVATGSGSSPSTPQSSVRRPQGARRRMQVQGLFVANPDNSDSDVSPKSSPVRASPVTTSSSGSGGRPIASLYSSGGSGGGGLPSPGGASQRAGGSSLSMYPSVPAPNTPITAFPSPHPAPPTPIHALPPPPPPSAPPDVPYGYTMNGGPPQPPPQPERHYHRAFTAPTPNDIPTRPHDTRHASLTGTPGHHPPQSPTRALPALPSPPIAVPQAHAPSPVSAQSMQGPSSLYAQPEASGSRPHLQHLHTLLKTNSPDDTLSPAQGSESGRSFASLSSESVVTRARSGSVQSHKVLLQVTMDNDQFSVVDITGMHTAEAILERVFSKLRFRDDDYATLSLFRTDIGEEPEADAVSKEDLLRLCQEQGDAKATLKFLVLQTAIPGSTASIVPPTQSGSERHLPPIDTRSHNRTSKDGSLHSASGSSVHDRQSDWSDLGAEWPGSAAGGSGLHRAKQNVRHVERRLPSASSSSRSLNLMDNQNPRDSRTSSPRSFVNVDHPSPKVYQPPPRSMTPSGSASAGPSRRNGNGHGEAGLGLFVDDGMDPETRALIAQMQREDEIARQQAQARQAQELADERFARNEQQQERDVWQAMQAMQLESRRQQQEQIELDEQRARDLDAEERAQEEERQRQEATRRDSHNQNRTAMFVNDRRAARQEWSHRNEGRDPPQDSWTLPSLGEGSRYNAERRPSETPPYLPSQQPIYTSPSTQFGSDVPNVYVRQPSRQSSNRYEEEDPHYLGNLRPGERLPPGASIQRRQPTRHPYGYANDGYNGGMQNARSVENLRPYGPAPVSRPPYQAVPPRPIGQPHPERAGYQNYRSSSTERTQDGRYPDPARTAPPHMGSVPFPSPQPRRQGSGEQTWLPYAQGSGSPRDFDYEPQTSRPKTGQDRSSPIINSPTTGTLPQRPSTLYDNSPPQTARAGEGYFPPGAQMPYYSHSRRNSVDPIVRGRTPGEEGARRASESSAGDAREGLSVTEGGWPGIARSARKETGDSDSRSGTVSSGVSDATLRPRGENDSVDTARAGDLQSQWRAMIQKGKGGTLVPSNRTSSESALEDDGEEATLWITAPSSSRIDSPARLNTERSPSRPNLTISTLGRDQPEPPLTSASASDSNTESEAEDGLRVSRNKSFAKPKDQWYFRPEPEQLYANLDALFPKIDLDKPIVEGLSTPTTPSDTQLSSSTAYPPPPVHPARSDARTVQSPKADKVDKHEKEKGGILASGFMTRFNKSENRRSLRNVAADFVRRSKDKRTEPAQIEATAPVSADEVKIDRAKQVVEVKPAGIAEGQPQRPEPIPESPSAEGDLALEPKAPISSWVKGELIGKGSYGRVYIGINAVTGSWMAVKQVELPATDRDRHDDRQLGMIEALRGEIALLKDLYHPNIVQYLGTETSPEHLSIFLEYVSGGTIATIYRASQSAFEEQLVKFFTKQILQGLSYLHAKQILHRDLKGDNILVATNGTCKISDFGISKQASDAYDSFGQATNMKGSVFWMAPEVIHSASERTYSGKVDIWSLGCVVMEMWTGQRPWGTMEQVAAMFELFNKRARPPLPTEIQANMSDVALDFLNERCLAKEPQFRPTAKELLQHRFILETDRNWTFGDSPIGKEVRNRGMRNMKAHVAAHGSAT